MGECLNKMWYVHTMVYYSAIKRNELLIHATIWMDLKGIMLSEKKPISKGYSLHNFTYITFT